MSSHIAIKFDQNLRNKIHLNLLLQHFACIPWCKNCQSSYDQAALDNQKNLKNIQNKENLLFCGSYFGYGFHEDGIKSSIEMLKNLND